MILGEILIINNIIYNKEINATLSLKSCLFIEIN